MPTKNITIYNKLVRNNIPDIIKQNGDIPIYKIVDNDKEYWNLLIKKDIEELQEVKKAKTRQEIKEELADKLEVLISMASHYNYTLEDIIEESDNKRKKKGSFSKRLFLEKTYNKE